MKFFKKKKSMKLNGEQKEIIEWLYRHQQETAYSTWRLLFQERKSKYPDRCIAYYDELSPKEKSEVELIIARYFVLYRNNQCPPTSIKQIFENLSYQE